MKTSQQNPIDQLARPLRDLRISITDRCNFRCTYCMPESHYNESYQFMDRSNILSYEEIIRTVKLFSQCGVKKLRITGGEPLVRKDCHQLISMLKPIQGIEDIALTTNGALLSQNIDKLKDAGLDRITVSLDSLDQHIFEKISGKSFPLQNILDGIALAKKQLSGPVKINMVVKKDINDHCVIEMLEYCKKHNLILRFIEFMDVGNLNQWSTKDVVSSKKLLKTIEKKWNVYPIDPNYKGEVAQRYQFSDGSGEFGFISSVSHPFCGDCHRARLSADGKLYTCLFAQNGFDLKTLLRNQTSDEDLLKTIKQHWTDRQDQYSQLRNTSSISSSKKVEMYSIGG